jgi:hypothetical protein
MNSMEWREMTKQERALLDLLLSATFSGKEAFIQQASSVRVRVIDAEGSLAFDLPSERAAAMHPIPVEAEATDRDGITVHMLLYVAGGKLAELEFYKDDSSPILELPPPHQWRLIELHG